LILIAKRTGLQVLLAHLRAIVGEDRVGIATMDELMAFNAPDNLRGERYRIMSSDALSEDLTNITNTYFVGFVIPLPSVKKVVERSLWAIGCN
jgi:hypothetical protein